MVSPLPGHSLPPSLRPPETLLYEALKHHVSPKDFETWFEPTACTFRAPNRFVLRAPNGFRCQWMEQHFAEIVGACARCVLEIDAEVQFVVDPGVSPGAVDRTNRRDPRRRGIPVAGTIGEILGQRAVHPTSTPSLPEGCTPNQDHTFETFVLGSCNRVAHAAAIRVSEDPSRSYNPLFIHGPAGVGKTHILHAACHRIVRTRRLQVLCVPATHLLTDSRRLADHRSALDPIDVLAIDDLHFALPMKENAQIELFHLMNSFLDGQKQIIFTSRLHPRDLTGIHPRLQSRFHGGLVVRIDLPDLETRVSILLRKARQRNQELPIDVAQFVAERAEGNVLELEGSLVRILGYASFHGCPPDLPLARIAFDSLCEDCGFPGAITIADILRAVPGYYRIPLRDFLARSKVRRLVFARQVGMFLARELTQLSLQEIGVHFGGRDHTTVLYAAERIAALEKTQPTVRADLQALRAALRAHRRA